MTAQSVTGRGPGSSEKAVRNFGPMIMLSGRKEIGLLDNGLTAGTVTFDAALPGGAHAYNVFLAPIGAANAYVVEILEQDGQTTGFNFVGEALPGESAFSVMYFVVKNGSARVS